MDGHCSRTSLISLGNHALKKEEGLSPYSEYSRTKLICNLTQLVSEDLYLIL